MKIDRLLWIVLFVILLALVACSSNRSAATDIQVHEPTIIVKVTEKIEEIVPEEKPTETPEVSENANESEKSEDNTPESEKLTDAPEIPQGKGLFDVDVMLGNLDDFVLRGEDMPNTYRLIENGEQHLTNRKVLNTVGEAEGKSYIAATSRLDGWSLELERVNKEDFAPYTIFSQIEVFSSAEGAQTAFSSDWFHVYTNEAREPNWIDNGCNFGDSCLMYYYEKIDPATELVTLQYEIAFIYNNILAQVMGRGLDFDMDPDYVMGIAEKLYEKIDTAPMN